ncbi:MAG: MFS transporter [Pseudomonadota bacterium]|nr:MFS transporter [Pseudomonadota bacterium]
MNLKPYLEAFRNRRIGTLLILGFASGLPLALISSPLQAWMATLHVNLKTIGLFSLVGLPYTLKFVWAPFMDRFAPPILGRRRSWILVAQICLSLLIYLMASVNPALNPGLMGILALILTFSSASQDIVIDAWRTDVLPEQERGLGAATYVLGYRIAMLVAGAVSLILSDQIGWPTTWRLMALIMLLSSIGTFIAPEPTGTITAPRTLHQAVIEPFKNFLTRDHALMLLLLIICYKLGDAFATSLNIVFLKETGFTSTEIGAIYKIGGLIALMLGSFTGGLLMVRLGLYRALMYFGLAQMVTVLPFVVLALTGRHYPTMIFAVCAENFGSGLGTTAFVAFLMALCDKRYSATQFALLSALSAIGRVFAGPFAGILAAHFGWVTFYTISFATSLPGIMLLYTLRTNTLTLKLEKDY